MQSTQGSEFMVGGVARTDDFTQMTVVASVVDKQENRGFVITPWMESTEIKDVFNTLILKYKSLITPEDKIVVKYRTLDNTLRNYETYNSSNQFTNVWVDGNTFTTTEDISAIKTRADAGIYDEVDIYVGKGAGYLSHITSITETGGTYTVNIDETVPDVTAGDKLQFMFCNWTKLGEATKDDIDNDEGYKIFPIDVKAKKIQFKIELRGFDIQIEEIIIKNETDRPVK
jgi:hypothetical protein